MISKSEVDDGKGKPHGFGVRHVQLLLLFSCMATTYLTRVNLSMAIVGMTDLNSTKNISVFVWEESTKGKILSSFFWGYLVSNIPAAIITHKFNNKLLLATVMTINSLLCFLTPSIVTHLGYVYLIVTRISQGLLQGFMMPTIHNLLSRWVPPIERARSGAFVLGGMHFGNAMIMFTSGFMLNSSTGWPLIYYVTGCVCLLWVALWCILSANSPELHQNISIIEKTYIKSTLIYTADHDRKLPIPWKSILTSKPVWAIVVAHMGQNWGMWTLLTEIPTFLHSTLNFDIKSDGQLSALPYFLMWIASFPLSFLADKLIKEKVMTIETSRKFWNNIGQTVSGLFLIALPYVTQYGSHTMSIAIYTLAVMLNCCILFGFNINHIDISPNFSCILMGLSNGASNITSILGPLFVGFVVKDETRISDWRPVFFMSATCYIVGSLVFTIFGSGKVQRWNDLQMDSKTNTNSNRKQEIE